MRRSSAIAVKDAHGVQSFAIAVTKDALTVPRICFAPTAEPAGTVSAVKETTAPNAICVRIALISSVVAVEVALNAFWYASPAERNVKTAQTAAFVRTAEPVWTVSAETVTTV